MCLCLRLHYLPLAEHQPVSNQHGGDYGAGLSLNVSFVFPEYLDELKQYGPTYTQWAGLEEELADPLKGVANCVEQCGKESEEQIRHLSEVLAPILHEYVLCAETLKVSPEHTANICSSLLLEIMRSHL